MFTHFIINDEKTLHKRGVSAFATTIPVSKGISTIQLRLKKYNTLANWKPFHKELCQMYLCEV